MARPTVLGQTFTVDESTELPAVRISQSLAARLDAKPRDLIYVSDSRSWLGGLRSTHAIVAQISALPDAELSIELPPAAYAAVITARRKDRAVTVERLY